MRETRLTLALTESGLVLPPSGPVALVKTPTETRISGIDPNRLCLIEGFKPFHDHWRSQGLSTACELEAEYAAVVVFLPRAKSEARALIARAMEVSAGPVVIDGQKTDGVDSVLREMRKRVSVEGPINKAHGKLFWITSPDADAFEDWRLGPSLTEGGFWTAPGVFSADAIDPASALLAAALPDDLGAHVADFGAGWGFLSAHVLTREAVERVHLVEAGFMALECAKRNVTDPRAVFHWADALEWQSLAPLDSIVMNPPFHLGRDPDPALGQKFVQAAARSLPRHGRLWLVANRHLPYETTLSECFGSVIEIGGDARFKLFQAARPLRKPARSH